MATPTPIGKRSFFRWMVVMLVLYPPMYSVIIICSEFLSLCCCLSMAMMMNIRGSAKKVAKILHLPEVGTFRSVAISRRNNNNNNPTVALIHFRCLCTQSPLPPPVVLIHLRSPIDQSPTECPFSIDAANG